MSEQEPRGATTAQLRDKIDRGATGSKVPFPDPAASPLGTDDEAAGTPPAPELVEEVSRRETSNPAAHAPDGRDANAAAGVEWRNAQAGHGHERDARGRMAAILIAAVLVALAVWLLL